MYPPPATALEPHLDCAAAPSFSASPDPSRTYQPFVDFAGAAAAAPTPLRAAITAATRRDEQEAVHWLLPQAASDAAAQRQTTQLARRLVEAVRKKRTQASGVDALMHEFSLSSEEGVALMCLAEALLRIPDTQTADRLIADKISKGDWKRHLGESPSLFVNAATWGLLVTGKLVGTSSEGGLGAALTRLIGKGGEPLIRKGLDLAMRMLGNQFVTGQTIEQALGNGRATEARGYRHSYDMLGEAALSAEDADQYYGAYEAAIHAIGKAARRRGIKDGPGISVKLSALHPRYARAQRGRVMAELLPRLKALTRLAREYDIGINIDAEEAERLELSLDLLEALALDPQLGGYDGIGFVVQAYQKRCPYVIDFLADLARRRVTTLGGKLMVRLVKGAYWDAEIKRAQVDGQPGYPVYTRKVHTDLSYLVCARKLLAATEVIYPQFATHNAQTLAAIHTHASHAGVDDYEFQCLHGMGETLYDQVVGENGLNRLCRIYAPVGPHRTLLAYLVRRLLENGANSSFVNQIVDPLIAIETLVADPVAQVAQAGGQPHPAIVLPTAIYGPGRRNSAGFDFSDEACLSLAAAALSQAGRRTWQALPLLAIPMAPDFAYAPGTPVHNPANRHDLVGTVTDADAGQTARALDAAVAQAPAWDGAPAPLRAQILEDAADLLEQHRFELMALAVREAGKSLPNALAEVREAVDFLRYYAAQVGLASASGAASALGVVVCISPWNFPLAIFIGQVAAALAAGNVVLAKPAEQTTLMAFRATQLLHEAGVPRAALQLVPGRGETMAALLCADARVDAVVFTGSGAVAASINRALAERGQREQRLLPLIAETGGQNAMIVDSSALTEQVVSDVLASAFDSAGQRCSALRVLCLQEEIAGRTLEMLAGALAQLRVGAPDRLHVDIGPVIDDEARAGLETYIAAHQAKAPHGQAGLFHRMSLPAECANGCFVAPTLLGIRDFSELEHEVFGPVLHALRYRRQELPRLLEQLRDSGYGLTLGIHSRIDETIAAISASAHVGNIYVNRNIVGAVVGVQPFGGEGKSGTGPKAGGPLYLARLQKNPPAVPAPAAAASREPAGHGQAGADTALDQLGQWAGTHGLDWLVERVDGYRRDSLLGRSMRLPGPTGEINSLRFAARGKLLCAAAARDSLLNQLAATLATGNHALLAAATAALLPPGLPEAVLRRISTAVVHDAHQQIAAALWDGVSGPALQSTLAVRPGALVPLVSATDREGIALWRLVAERALCVNTTAAGGNASLMTLEAG